jgi:hypothetical protein
MTKSREQTWAAAVIFIDLVDARLEAVHLLDMLRQLA